MNIFEFAMKMEKDGELFYREMVKKTTNKNLKALLTLLADDEVKHYNLLNLMNSQQNPELVETHVLRETKNIFQKMYEDDKVQAFDFQEHKMFEKALEAEEMSEDFYTQKASETGIPYQKSIFLGLADEEKKHQILLENLQEFLETPENYIENAEFNKLFPF